MSELLDESGIARLETILHELTEADRLRVLSYLAQLAVKQSPDEKNALMLYVCPQNIVMAIARGKAAEFVGGMIAGHFPEISRHHVDPAIPRTERQERLGT